MTIKITCPICKESVTSSKLESHDCDPVCEDCGGTGLVTEGEFDDIREKKCHCQHDDYNEDDQDPN